MIEKVILNVNGKQYSLIHEQPTIQLADKAEISIEVRGSEPQYGVEIKCFLVYPPPPKYEGCGACGSIRVPDSQLHSFVVQGDTYGKEGQGRLEFVIDDFVGTVIRAAAVMQRVMFMTL